jgi:YD repeat-containing protein
MGGRQMKKGRYILILFLVLGIFTLSAGNGTADYNSFEKIVFNYIYSFNGDFPAKKGLMKVTWEEAICHKEKGKWVEESDRHLFSETSYDDQGRITQETEYESGVLNRRTSYTYDNLSRVVEEYLEQEINNPKSTIKTKYYYTGSQIYPDLARSNTGSETFLFIFDEHGHLKKMTKKNFAGEVYYVYMYDTYNRPLRILSSLDDKNYNEHIVYSYDKRGNCVKKVEGSLTGTIEEIIEYTYDKQNKMVQEYKRSYDRSFQEWVDYEYDSFGELTRMVKQSVHTKNRFMEVYYRIPTYKLPTTTSPQLPTRSCAKVPNVYKADNPSIIIQYDDRENRDIVETYACEDQDYFRFHIVLEKAIFEKDFTVGFTLTFSDGSKDRFNFSPRTQVFYYQIIDAKGNINKRITLEKPYNTRVDKVNSGISLVIPKSKHFGGKRGRNI